MELSSQPELVGAAENVGPAAHETTKMLKPDHVWQVHRSTNFLYLAGLGTKHTVKKINGLVPLLKVHSVEYNVECQFMRRIGIMPYLLTLDRCM